MHPEFSRIAPYEEEVNKHSLYCVSAEYRGMDDCPMGATDVPIMQHDYGNDASAAKVCEGVRRYYSSKSN